MSGKIVLASASQSRRTLLANAGLDFQWVAAAIDERAIEQSLGGTATPVEVAMELARKKSLNVSARVRDCWVIGCDQTMSLGDEVFHKSADMESARAQLRRLAGQVHRLNSAVALSRNGTVVWDYVDLAELHMRPFTDGFLQRYLEIAGEKILSSVGGYQLEGPGIQLFSAISGDYFTILGLPLLPLLGELRRRGAIDE